MQLVRWSFKKLNDWDLTWRRRRWRTVLCGWGRGMIGRFRCKCYQESTKGSEVSIFHVWCNTLFQSTFSANLLRYLHWCNACLQPRNTYDGYIGRVDKGGEAKPWLITYPCASFDEPSDVSSWCTPSCIPEIGICVSCASCQVDCARGSSRGACYLRCLRLQWPLRVRVACLPPLGSHSLWRRSACKTIKLHRLVFLSSSSN